MKCFITSCTRKPSNVAFQTLYFKCCGLKKVRGKWNVLTSCTRNSKRRKILPEMTGSDVTGSEWRDVTGSDGVRMPGFFSPRFFLTIVIVQNVSLRTLPREPLQVMRNDTFCTTTIVRKKARETKSGYAHAITSDHVTSGFGHVLQSLTVLRVNTTIS
jgi:hypothetical protein